MIRVHEELKEYFYNYYDYNKQFDIPKNINVLLLEKNEFFDAIKIKSKEVFGINYNNISDTLNGLIIVDSKNKYRNTYNIYILNQYEEIYPYIVNVLFHELSHAHTLPNIDIIDMKKYDNSNNGYSLLGYNFWREFIANYLGNKTFLNTCGSINYVEDEEKLIEYTINKISELKEDCSSIDDLISFILLSNKDITNKIKEKINIKIYENFKEIIEICKVYVEKENYEIDIDDYNKLGKLINNMRNN